MLVNTNRLNDMPAEQDALGLDRYFEGLANYILSCPTPMTIAIQGGWGTGKTTAMNMIKAKIGNNEKLIQIDFNTWQYSRVSGGNLFLPLLRRMDKEIGKKYADVKENNAQSAEKKDQELAGSDEKRSPRVFTRAMFLAGNTAAAFDKTGFLEAVMRVAQSAVQGAVNLPGEQDFSEEAGLIYDHIAELKDHLDKEIEVLEKTYKINRIVFFVDDLDRLEPENAVSFLEDLKNFMQCRNCVFVLALDHEIVRRGLRKKYGFTRQNEGDYASRFFDKLIQLPFNLPCHQYDVEKYVTSLLDEGSGLKEKGKVFAEIIRAFGDTNPRSIKRLFMIFSMYGHIGNPLYEGNKDRLFALLLLQMNHEKLYRSLLEAVEEDLSDPEIRLLDAFCDPGAEYRNVDSWFVDMKSGKDSAIAEKLEELFAADRPGQNKYELLFDIIGTTAITGSGEGSGQLRVEATTTMIEDYMDYLHFRKDGDKYLGEKAGCAVMISKFEESSNVTNHVNLNIEAKSELNQAAAEKRKQYIEKNLIDGEKFEIRTEFVPADAGMDIMCNLPRLCALRQISVTERASMKFTGRILRNIAATGRMFP